MRDALIALISAPFWLLLAPLVAAIAGAMWLGLKLWPSIDAREDVTA
jgi:hypothetical protein